MVKEEIDLQAYIDAPEKYLDTEAASLIIDAMEVKAAGIVYGDSAKKPDASVLVMSDAFVSVNLNMPKGLKYSVEKDTFVVEDVIAYQRSTNSDLSNWNKFIAKNGIPKKGLEIEVVLNDNLFYDIIM